MHGPTDDKGTVTRFDGNRGFSVKQGFRPADQAIKEETVAKGVKTGNIDMILIAVITFIHNEEVTVGIDINVRALYRIVALTTGDINGLTETYAFGSKALRPKLVIARCGMLFYPGDNKTTVFTHGNDRLKLPELARIDCALYYYCDVTRSRATIRVKKPNHDGLCVDIYPCDGDIAMVVDRDVAPAFGKRSDQLRAHRGRIDGEQTAGARG